MLQYRTFRNIDPPNIAAAWRSRTAQRGLMQPISVDLLEQAVFGRLYFDYEGMVLAFDGDRTVGFAHASFGPNEHSDGPNPREGVLSALVVRPEYEQGEVPAELLARCEAYLRKHGAKVVWAGARWPKTPFYCGLYGGVEVPGVLESDPLHDLCPTSGYEPAERTLIFRLNLATFRPRVDRQQMQFRRRLLVQVLVDPPLRSWWQACILGDFDLTRFEILPRDGREPMAEALVRAVQGSGNFAIGPAAGLLYIRVEASQRRQGLATFLLGEAFRTLASQGVQEVEAQAVASNEPLIGLLKKLGFEQVAQATVYRKPLTQDGMK